jgi:glycosyltransferase involved in cell wall biosynthesis
MIEPIVCVPARNESKRLPALLRSLQQQTWLRGNNRSLQTVLVLNNCDDNSRAAVQRSAPDLPDVSLHLIEVQFASENAHVGSALRLAMETAFRLAPNNFVLFSTDADAIPRHDWIETNLRAIASGADLVGGHIVGNKQEEASLGPRFVRRAAGLHVQLFFAFKCNEAHGWTGCRLSDRFRISVIVLLCLDVGPYILRRHHPNRVSQG